MKKATQQPIGKTNSGTPAPFFSRPGSVLPPSGAFFKPHTTADTAREVPEIQAFIYSSPTNTTDPNALIPLNDFIRYIEAVERAYPQDGPEETLARIRRQYYGGLAFSRLIPGSPTHEVVGTRRVFNRQMGEMYETPITQVRELEESRIGGDAYRHLTARADENAQGDNPSPYLVLPNRERIDVGHLLLGLDALLHPTTLPPYSSFGVPNIDPSSWVADLGIAAVWMTHHEEEGSPHDDVVNPPSSANLSTYYQKSAPEEDLLSDVDSFGMHAQWQAQPGRPLSQVLRTYYAGTGANTMQQRWQLFCAANNLSYTRQGNTISWSSTLRPFWIRRINRFNDLYNAGRWRAGASLVIGPTARRSWPHTPAVLDRFLAWVKSHLEAELARNSSSSTP